VTGSCGFPLRRIRPPRRAEGTGKSRLCSLSMGSSIAPLPRTVSMNTGPRPPALLVCEEKLLACARSGGVGEACRSNDGGHDAVDSGQRSHFESPASPASILQPKRSRERLVQPRPSRGIRHARRSRGGELAQLRQLVDLPMAVNAATRKRDGWARITSRVLDRSSPWLEYRVVLNGHLMTTITASGSMAIGASMRSSIRRGRVKRAAVLHPAWRFIRDSNRSQSFRPRRVERTGRIDAGATLMAPQACPRRRRARLQPTAPATPSQVFPGLMEGAKLRLRSAADKIRGRVEIQTVARVASRKEG